MMPGFYATAMRGGSNYGLGTDGESLSDGTTVDGKERGSERESKKRMWSKEIEDGPYILRTTHVHVQHADLEGGVLDEGGNVDGGSSGGDGRSRRRSDQSAIIGAGVAF